MINQKMDLNKLIANYKELSLKIHLENDFVIKKKYIDKSNAIIKKIREKKLEKEFFEGLFLSSEPWVLIDAASDGFNCCYDIHKCLSIMEYIKSNANSLVFCSDSIKNEKERQYYSNYSDINTYRKEVKFYDSLKNDYLYKKCNEYFDFIAKQINWYYSKNNKNNKDMSAEIMTLLNELKAKNYLGSVLDIANEKYQQSEYLLNYLAVNSYCACKIKYKQKKYRKILAGILKLDAKKLTPNLISLVNKYLEDIDSNETCLPSL